jgi:plastocyanin
MVRIFRTICFAVLAASALSGCKPDAALRRSEVLDKSPQPYAAPSPETTGAIIGIVSFKGQPPARVPIDMSMDPACSLTAGQNLSEQYIVNAGKIANVFVYIKSGAPASSAPSDARPVVLDQKGCRYVPHVIAIQQGGAVEFRNSDPTMHNIHTISIAGNPQVDVSQGPAGAPQTRQFTTPELMMPVRCNNHPWMEALLNVAPNPYFAVTREDGTFSIPGLPSGTYTLAAVHEKLGEQDMQITVIAKSKSRADFTFAMK